MTAPQQDEPRPLKVPSFRTLLVRVVAALERGVDELGDIKLLLDEQNALYRAERTTDAPAPMCEAPFSIGKLIADDIRCTRAPDHVDETGVARHLHAHEPSGTTWESEFHSQELPHEKKS